VHFKSFRTSVAIFKISLNFYKIALQHQDAEKGEDAWVPEIDEVGKDSPELVLYSDDSEVARYLKLRENKMKTEV
jgi:hypothetical protein